MSTIYRFEDLDIWQKARIFCRNISRVVSYERFSHDFALKNQIRASSGSVMDNIAEGFERGGNREFMQFLYIAKGSCGESRSQLYRALDSNYLQESEFNLLQQESTVLSKSISGFIAYLKNSEMKGNKYKKTQDES
jgi:four helix bundle protein